jgi:hypothetical protein
LIRSWLFSSTLKGGKDIEQPQCSLYWGRFRRLETGIMLFIDVHREAVVWGAGTERYLALSYVWGDAKQLQLTKANFEQLTQDGAVGVNVLEIPETIRDAIRVCHLLGEHYLWVDSLCIIQDDEENKKEQIAMMGDIYSKAYITIVAVAGEDANYGLAGVGRPRSVPQERAIIHSVPLITSERSWIHTAKTSKWYSRMCKSISV